MFEGVKVKVLILQSDDHDMLSNDSGDNKQQTLLPELISIFCSLKLCQQKL